MAASLMNVRYKDLDLEYYYDNEYIYYEEATEMIRCVCQNTPFPRSIKKMQAILDACARVRSDVRWRDDTMIPRIFDEGVKVDISQYKTKLGNPSANSESRMPTDDIWVRSPDGWIIAEKRCTGCDEKKPFRFFNLDTKSVDQREDLCTRCKKDEAVEIEYI